MKPIYEVCKARPEVLQGELREDIFAARLRDVIEGHAEDVYREPAVFFEIGDAAQKEAPKVKF